MRIECEACGAEIPAANVDFGRDLAKCESCNHVFNCQAQLGAIASPGSVERAEVPLPKGIHLYRRSNGIRIVRRWFAPKFIALAFFCCFWDTFMIVWYYQAIKNRIWVMAAFGVLHAAVGIGLSWGTLAGFLNKTVITAMRGMLEIKHGPIPVPGNRRLPTDQLSQLYTKESISHSENGGTSVSYELHAQCKDGRDVKLLGGLDKKDQAVFAEQRLEEFLQIADAPVAGEVAR